MLTLPTEYCPKRRTMGFESKSESRRGRLGAKIKWTIYWKVANLWNCWNWQDCSSGIIESWYSLFSPSMTSEWAFIFSWTWTGPVELRVVKWLSMHGYEIEEMNVLLGMCSKRHLLLDLKNYFSLQVNRLLPTFNFQNNKPNHSLLLFFFMKVINFICISLCLFFVLSSLALLTLPTRIILIPPRFFFVSNRNNLVIRNNTLTIAILLFLSIKSLFLAAYPITLQ